MKAILRKQLPKKEKNGTTGILSIDTSTLVNKRTAYFLDEQERCVATLNNPEVVWINPHGIYLKGYEPDGVDKTGRQKYKYQEWFCYTGELKVK